jgi:hypothetical protein
MRVQRVRTYGSGGDVHTERSDAMPALYMTLGTIAAVALVLSFAAVRILRPAHPMTSLRVVLLASVLGLVFAASAGAQRGTFETRMFTEPAKPGLAVTGALSGYRVTSTSRVIVPTKWRSLAAPAGRLRYATVNNPSCRYNVTYTVKSVLAPRQDPSAYVAAALPSPSARHLLDSGVHGNRAFRVVRQQGIGGRVRLDALWAAVLTTRADIAPPGQVAWTEIRVTAVSRAGDECHSGTWRQALGPAIGDSLAVARTRLHFTKSS